MCATALQGAVYASQGEAYPGEPFGVGMFTVALPPGDAELAEAKTGFFLEERNARALYPVFASGPVRRLLGEILGVQPVDRSGSLTVLFLFVGERPLELTVYTPSPQRVLVTPVRGRNSRAQDRLLLRWWREFHGQTRQQVQQGDYPPLVETYLTSMLSRRLRLAPPLLSRLEEPPTSVEPYRTLQLLAGVESLRLETLRRSNLGQLGEDRAATLPLPAPIRWSPPPPVAIASDREIEPIAMRVPEECFYIRFGTFGNYLWLERLQKDYGGDIGRMITLRGYDAGVNQRNQRQLALRSSALAELFGPTLVADVAMIGRDLYLREGPAVGMLFQARDELLGHDLLRQRAAVLQDERAAGAMEQTVQIGGREVSFLSTPDNRVRSFYAVDGDFHLVTTSRAIVERFFEVSSGPENRSLGESVEFQHARSLMPTDRQDTIFLYFGAPFLQGLVSPQYQVELARRLRAVTELESLQLASWAAWREGQPAETLEDLIGGGFLPAGFGSRADGSRPVVAPDDTLLDSLRGARGTFTPVPDVEIDAITRQEAARLAEQAAFYADSWKRLDPLMVGVKRYALDRQGQERIVIDAHVSPFGEEKYGWLTSLVGPPTRVRIQPVAGDVITAQAVVRGGSWLPQISLHHLFLGVQDHESLGQAPRGGILDTLRLITSTPGYLGAWPRSGFLDILPLGLGGGPPDALGYSRLPLGLWRRQWDGFSALAFDPQLLARVTPELAVEETEDEAQLRVHVGDLSQAKLRSWVNLLTHTRAQQASLGNARLLHAMSQQLGLPPEEAQDAAERLLDARLVCSLGGEYRLNDSQRWASTAWPDGDPQRLAADYEAPLLEWFRGLDLQATMYGDHVVLHAELDLQRKPTERAVQLPLFNLFGRKAKPEPQGEPDPEDAPAEPAPQP